MLRISRVCLLIGASLTVACSQEPTASDDANAAAHTGTVALDLLLPDDSNVEVVHYEVSRGGVVVRSGDAVPGPNGRASIAISGLDAGSGYRVQLTAPRSVGTPCVGETEFSVLEAQTTAIDVTMQCDASGGADGNITVNGTFNLCPRVTATSITPLVVAVGSEAKISASASDRDGDPLSFSWSATGGTFSLPAARDTSYRCDEAGVKQLTLTVSDGPQRGCSRSTVLMITCVGTSESDSRAVLRDDVIVVGANRDEWTISATDTSWTLKANNSSLRMGDVLLLRDDAVRIAAIAQTNGATVLTVEPAAPEDVFAKISLRVPSDNKTSPLTTTTSPHPNGVDRR